MLAAFWPETPGADDDDLGVGDTTHTSQQHTPAALGLHQRVGTDLRRETAGDLGHRVEQRQRTRGQLHGLVGDAGDLALGQLLGQRLVGGEVEVGEQHLPLGHPVVLLGDRLLDLEHHLRLAPHVIGRVDDRRARGDVLGVTDLRADTGVLLDAHLVAVGHQLVHPDGRDRHPVLVVLDFLGYADAQRSSCSSPPLPAGVATSSGRPSSLYSCASSRSEVSPASPITRSTLRQVSLARSSSDQPRSASAASSRG